MGRFFCKILLIIGGCLQLSMAQPALDFDVEARDFHIKAFEFTDGKKMDNLKIHYRVFGNPQGPAVLILHGTTGSGQSMLSQNFAGELFAKGMPLDAEKFLIILPDSIGTGGSSKPSDGLKGDFPHYNYQDSVRAHYQLLTQELGIEKLYLIIGNSMGGMQAWEWATLYPDYMEKLIPMAATPMAMSSRNWLMRKMVIDSITEDPAWQNGFYSTQPQKFQKVYTYYSIATNGGDIAWQQMAYDRATSEAILQERLNKPVTMDANDFLYQWDSSRDFDPTPLLATVKASVLAINSEDDERNPVLTRKLAEALQYVKGAKTFIIPASKDTRGHATVMDARLWKHKLIEFLATPDLIELNGG